MLERREDLNSELAMMEEQNLKETEAEMTDDTFR